MKKLLLIVWVIVLLAGCAQTGPKKTEPMPPPAPAPAPVVKKPPACVTCATVTAIATQQVQPTDTTTPAKPVLGGLVGGVVSTTQKDQPKLRTQYKVSVRMDNGELRTIVANSISANMRVGSRVMVQGDRVTLLR